MPLRDWTSIPLTVALISGCLACTPTTTKTRIEHPPSPGALQGSLSVQITAASRKLPVLFTSANFAELLGPASRNRIRERGFRIEGEGADQHLIVHVNDAGRGTGTVRTHCELEIWLYPRWPGKLAPEKNAVQGVGGGISTMKPLLHFTLAAKDQNRGRMGGESLLKAGAEYCADELAQTLVELQKSAPPGPGPAPTSRRASTAQ